MGEATRERSVGGKGEAEVNSRKEEEKGTFIYLICFWCLGQICGACEVRTEAIVVGRERLIREEGETRVRLE